MSDLHQFKTTSIHLAAAILAQVPDTTLVQVSSTPSIDGKRLIIVGYPSGQTKAVDSIVKQFHSRRLTVHLYNFNRVLNLVRDRLLQNEPHHAFR